MCTYTYNSVTDLDAVLQMDFLVAIAVSPKTNKCFFHWFGLKYLVYVFNDYFQV